jgi:hypothetical protein
MKKLMGIVIICVALSYSVATYAAEANADLLLKRYCNFIGKKKENPGQIFSPKFLADNGGEKALLKKFSALPKTNCSELAPTTEKAATGTGYIIRFKKAETMFIAKRDPKDGLYKIDSTTE